MNSPMILEQQSTHSTVRREPPLPPEEPKRNLWWLWILLFAGLIYGGYRFYQAQLAKHAAKAAAEQAKLANRLVSVVIAPAHTGDMPVTLSGLGSVTAFQTVTVKTRVDGQLTRVAFQEGQYVHEGDLLAEIDPRTYQVQLAQAQGQLARDEAQLRDAEANLVRYKALFAAQVIARQQLDTQGALVGQFQGAIEADNAQIEQARLQLTYCRILAPISGRIGLRQVDQGNMVHAADTNGIAVITQLQPISVLFSIPEDNLPDVLRRLRSNPRLPVDAYDRDGSEKLASGTLLTVDNQIDPTTGTSKLKAVFDNSQNNLFPNQFVNVRLHLDTRHGAVIVPAAAIQRGPEGTYVYVIKDNVAHLRPVTTGTVLAGDISIEKGLENGEQVVVDGADKLREGLKVDARPAVQNGRERGKKA
jgi:membrane fusion protein, multidrug efflux system